MFAYPKIHEIRSASDMLHPASTAENPITAAYVLVIRDRSPEGCIGDGFLDWNYLLWWRRRWALSRELCLALRAETLVPDGEPQANDKFLEFSKDKLRFGYRENDIRRLPDAPDLHEIGAAAEGFMAALFSPRFARSLQRVVAVCPIKKTHPFCLRADCVCMICTAAGSISAYRSEFPPQKAKKLIAFWDVSGLMNLSIVQSLAGSRPFQPAASTNV